MDAPEGKDPLRTSDERLVVTDPVEVIQPLRAYWVVVSKVRLMTSMGARRK